MTTENLSIIDSHIHLYAESHLSGLNWTGELPSDHILNRQNSVEQYKHATRQDNRLLGFVFLETDRKSSLDESSWKDPLEEAHFLARIANGRPLDGEGHVAADSRLVLGIVPWAPIPAGPKALSRYVSLIESACETVQAWKSVKGFRYLMQDKPAGTMLRPGFVAGLQWLGERNYSFDLGVDLRQGGSGQLTEACEMFRQLFRNGSSLRVVINHFCKPNMHLQSREVTGHEEFSVWSKCIKTFASYPTTFMKLSGFFSELPPQDENEPTPIPLLFEYVKPWVDVVFDAFGSERIMFGSDWPVCSAGGPGSKAWQHWVDLVTVILDTRGLSPHQKQRVWSGTAIEAYRIELPSR